MTGKDKPRHVMTY